MESSILLLPDNVANQIAAGEVIQRPASVIKELMENAVDAGATKIEVFIKEAGKSLIQVVDNGKGMNAKDAEICFLRHATSKVRTADDLFALTTKGFRGEALASIAAIAHVELKTRTASEEVGTLVKISGSKISEKETIACPQGTSLEIKNLFFNVPARRNFLKSDNVEFKHIQEEFERVVLAHPNIQFSLKHNANEIHHLLPGNIRKRIVDVLGKKSNDRLVPIEESTDIVSFHGFAIKPEFSKKTRGQQYFFINDRFFKSAYFNHAITKAYEGLLKEREFPGYFLYMTVDPTKIDVNVHPTKTEIKFEEEKYIYSILLSSVRQALGKYNIAPTLDFERETGFDLPYEQKNAPIVEPNIKVNPNYNPFQTTSRPTGSSSGKTKDNFSPAIKSQGFGTTEASSKDWENFYTFEEKEAEKQETLEWEEEDSTSGFYILKNGFILSPSKSGFLVIHARRAIQQIEYEKAHSSFMTSPLASQNLLFPLEKEMDKNELIAWQESQSMLNQMGFSWNKKEDSIELTAVPSALQEETIQKTIENLLEVVCHREIEKGDLAHEIIGLIAKQASRKQLHLTTQEAMKSLVEQLFQCEQHSFTFDGKKIMETINMDSIQQKFN